MVRKSHKCEISPYYILLTIKQDKMDLMKKTAVIIILLGLFQTLYSQNLVYVDGVEIAIPGPLDVHVEGGIVLQNEGYFDSHGSVYLGSSGSGYVPSEANWTNNNISEPGNRLSAKGEVRMLLDGTRVLGTLSSGQAAFNVLLLEASNSNYWQDIPVEILTEIKLGVNNTWETNNQLLYISTPALSGISSGSGGIRLESGPPLPAAGQWSKLRMATSSSALIYSVPLRDVPGNNFQFLFSTLAGTPADVSLSSYGTTQNNQPLPEAFSSLPPVPDADINNNGTDDSNRMVDRYWLISTERDLNNLLIQLPESEASTGELTPMTDLMPYGFDTDWNLLGGSGDATTGVSLSVAGPMTLIVTLAGDELPVSVSDPNNQLEAQITVAPNPAAHNSKITLPVSLIGSLLHITSIGGKRLRSERVISQTHELMRNDLPAGVYFITLEEEDSRNSFGPLKLIFVD